MLFELRSLNVSQSWIPSRNPHNMFDLQAASDTRKGVQIWELGRSERVLRYSVIDSNLECDFWSQETNGYRRGRGCRGLWDEREPWTALRQTESARSARVVAQTADSDSVGGSSAPASTPHPCLSRLSVGTKTSPVAVSLGNKSREISRTRLCWKELYKEKLTRTRIIEHANPLNMVYLI